MDALNSLEQNLQTLLERYANLQAEIIQLREDNERQRDEIMRTHADFLALQEQYKQLRIAKSLSDSPEQQEIAKRHLTNIINRVDRVIEILKK